MARAGLGPSWSCLFANDIDAKKGASYSANWGSDRLVVGDVAELTPRDLPDQADLAWASFPCQDLSLAGDGAGLKGPRSGSFWPFWRLIEALGAEWRAPSVVVLENVCGTVSSHGGRDFAAIGAALGANYRFGAMVIDALEFLPQSRPRLFFVGVRKDLAVPSRLTAGQPDGLWHPHYLVDAFQKLTKHMTDDWIWWRLPAPTARRSVLSDLIEDEPLGVSWHTPPETERLLSLMSPLNQRKLELAKRAGGRRVGAVYKRTRHNGNGIRVQRAEVRFDDVSGCLRTPTGGSSRQTLIIVEGGKVRSRLLSPREAARLMGLPDAYILPPNYNEAYHLAGDGVAVPVVRHLAAHLLDPLLASTAEERRETA